MSKSLDDLDPRFKPKAIELIARCIELEVPVVIIETKRTELQQLENLLKGVSWIKHSKHLDGLAIDICPYEQYQIHGTYKLDWDSNDVIWNKIGSIGQKLGLTWGGTWREKDLGHFEYKEEA